MEQFEEHVGWTPDEVLDRGPSGSTMSDAEFEAALLDWVEPRPIALDLAPQVLESCFQLPADATEDELFDVAEQFQRQQGRLDLMRADHYAVLWSRRRKDANELIAVVREIGVIRGCSSGAAERMLAASLRLSHGFHPTRDRIASGELPWDHAEVLLIASKVIDQERVDEFERKALALIEGCSIGQVRDRIRRLVDTMQPEGMEKRHKDAVKKRNATVEPGADGMAWIHLYIGAVDAIAISDRRDRYARAAHGDEGEERTLAQLRADAAVDLLLEDTEEATEDELQDGDRKVARGNTIKPEVYVTVPVMTLLGKSEEPGQLRGYGPIDPATARCLTADAPSLYRLLTNPETGVVLSLGSEHYEPSAGLKRYLRIRDERCRFPGCNRSSHLCDIDHVVPWHRNGTTDADNLICLCPRNHDDKDRGHTVEMLPDGRARWTTPWGRVGYTRAAVDIGWDPPTPAQAA